MRSRASIIRCQRCSLSCLSLPLTDIHDVMPGSRRPGQGALTHCQNGFHASSLHFRPPGPFFCRFHNATLDRCRHGPLPPAAPHRVARQGCGPFLQCIGRARIALLLVIEKICSPVTIAAWRNQRQSECVWLPHVTPAFAVFRYSETC